MNRTNFDSEERDFQREIEAALRANRERVGACPRPELLMAACSGVPFEGAGGVQRHMAICPICEQLSGDLSEYEFPAATNAEDRRIRSRWQAARGGPTASWLRIWRTWFVAAAVAMLVVGILVVRGRHQSATSSSKETAQQTTPRVAPLTPPTSPLTLAKAAIKIPAAAVLTFRGDANEARTYLIGLAAALEPYRKDNYAEAARMLAALSLKYPDAAEPAFYAGVSRLFLNQNESAIESLQSARRHAGETLRDDISWYLALAFNRAGKTSDARREAEALCLRAGEYKDRACAAADQLKSR
jgi:hypothetical protein